jgi:hypothetical protein
MATLYKAVFTAPECGLGPDFGGVLMRVARLAYMPAVTGDLLFDEKSTANARRRLTPCKAKPARTVEVPRKTISRQRVLPIE